MNTYPGLASLSGWRRGWFGAKIASRMAANAYAAFIGCVLGLYLINYREIPADKVIPWLTLIWWCVAILFLAVFYWAMAGAVMGSNYPVSHLSFSGACWGLIGATIGLLEPLMGLGILGPLTWLQGLILIGVMVLIALSGLFGWAVGDRITEIMKKVDEELEQQFKSGTLALRQPSKGHESGSKDVS